MCIEISGKKDKILHYYFYSLGNLSEITSHLRYFAQDFKRQAVPFRFLWNH